MSLQYSNFVARENHGLKVFSRCVYNFIMKPFKIEVSEKACADIDGACAIVPIGVGLSFEEVASEALRRVCSKHPELNATLLRKLPIALGAAFPCTLGGERFILAPSTEPHMDQETCGWSYFLSASLVAAEHRGISSLKVDISYLSIEEIEEFATALTYIARGYFGAVERIVVCAGDNVVCAEFADEMLEAANSVWAA
jgi:hypothetical protein